MLRRTALLVLALLLPWTPLRAEVPPRTHDITLDDYFTQATPFEVALSPDGRYTAAGREPISPHG